MEREIYFLTWQPANTTVYNRFFFEKKDRNKRLQSRSKSVKDLLFLFVAYKAKESSLLLIYTSQICTQAKYVLVFKLRKRKEIHTNTDCR